MNIFDEDQEKRTKDQQNKEERTTGDIVKKERTTLCLSVTKDDKRLLQMYAAKRGETTASIIHKWITEYCIPEEAD